MVDHNAVRLALRGRVLALVVCTTGATNLSATVDGYARTAGSFLDDGFAPGMEVTPAGFGANPIGVVTAVTDLQLQILGGRAVEAQAPARSLSVGLPRVTSIENAVVEDAGTPTADGQVVPERPYFHEQYLPGPAVGGGIGPKMRIFAQPMYLPRVFVPQGYGPEAATKYAGALLALFPLSDVIALTATDAIHIRSNPAPYPGQLLSDGKSHAGILCTVPAECHSLNTI